MGRLDRGDECVERLEEFFAERDIRGADLRAVGRLSAIDLVRFDSERGDYEEIYAGDGTFDLVQLSGNVSTLGDEVVVRLHALLAADGPVHPQLMAGELRSATAAEFEFVAEIYDDLEMVRQLDAETGTLELQSIRRRESAADGEREGPTLEGRAMSWNEAAESTDDESPKSGGAEAAPRSDEEGTGADEPADDRDPDDESDPYEGVDLEEPALESGDIIDHPKLGRCRVIKIEEDKYAHIRLPQGKIRKLSLNVVDITYIGDDNGHNVFEAQVQS